MSYTQVNSVLFRLKLFLNVIIHAMKKQKMQLIQFYLYEKINIFQILFNIKNYIMLTD